MTFSPIIHNKNRWIHVLALAWLSQFAIFYSSTANSTSETETVLDENGPLIVVTLKPLYSLVAHIAEGVSSPVLLIKQIPMGHHYNLRPSQRKLIADADTIIWFGPQMEPYLSNIIDHEADREDTRAEAISALQAPGLKLLKKRSQGVDDKSHRPDHSDIDPHIWLSSRNAIAISQHIARSLIASDPKNADSYRNNLAKLTDLIKATDEEVRNTLQKITSHSGHAFIAYHDAFQYFETEYQLNHVATIAYEEGAGPGLKHLQKITSKIRSQEIRCLVYQRPKPALVDALVDQTSITTVALDPVGTETRNTKTAWFDIMQNLAQGFEQCLNNNR